LDQIADWCQYFIFLTSKRTKVEAVVPDSAVKVIIDGLNEISPGKEAHDMIFVRDANIAG
jgi:hypothetical protein